MKYEDKTKVQLINVLSEVSQRIAELEASEVNYVQAKEAELRKSHDELKRRFKAQTTELSRVHALLKQETEKRKRVEKKLEITKRDFDEVNAALKVLLKRRDEDKAELEDKVMFNIRQLVMPHLEKLKSGLDKRQLAFAMILESNLNDIVSPFSRSLSARYLSLTPAEIQVANLIKQGKSTKEIADLWNVSGKTIEDYRKNIRKKLGIKNKKVNLRTQLLSLQ
jgi:DNA-binding CsgD family transcriptional regulator